MWLFLSAASHFKLSLNVFQSENFRENGKNSVSNSKFKAIFLGYKSRGPGQRLWLSHIPGWAKSWLRPKVRPGFFWLGLARLLASGQSWHI